MLLGKRIPYRVGAVREKACSQHISFHGYARSIGVVVREFPEKENKMRKVIVTMMVSLNTNRSDQNGYCFLQYHPIGRRYPGRSRFSHRSAESAFGAD